jgi:uncharacterized protein (TIGR02145 family)
MPVNHINQKDFFMNIFSRYGRTLLLAAVVIWTVICLSGCVATATQSAYPTTSQNASPATTPETSSGSAMPAPTGNVGDNVYNTAPRPKAAVYIMGNPQGRDALRMAVNTFLVKSGKYQMIAVDAIDVVAQEQKRQMSGSVSDAQIAKLGYDAGAQYVCVVERTELDGFSYVATRMVSVENKVAEFADMVKLPHGGDIIAFIQWQIGSMLGMAVGPRPAAATSAYTASASVAPAQSTPAQSGTAPTQGGASPSAKTSDKYITVKTVRIGEQTWMAENLNIKMGNSWCYDIHESSCDRYGRLYDFETAKKACPSGWHLPTRQEWNDLIDAVGGENVAGKKLKSKSRWSNNGNGTDDYGFSALPGGGRLSNGSFSDAGYNGFWWTVTEDDAGSAYLRGMHYNYDSVNGYSGVKGNGSSVRCIRDD